MAGPVEAMFTAKHAGAFAAPMNAGYGSEADVLRVLEQAVDGREFLVGDRFTTADLYMAAFLGYYMMIGMLEKRPAYVAYESRHTQRPAALAANARDNALLPAHPHPSQATATTEVE